MTVSAAGVTSVANANSRDVDMQIPDYQCFIDGEWAPADSGDFIDVLDPSCGAVIARVARGGRADIDRSRIHH